MTSMKRYGAAVWARVTTTVQRLLSRGKAETPRLRILIVIAHDKSWWSLNAVQQFIATLRENMGQEAEPIFDIVSLQCSQEKLQAFIPTLMQEPRYDLVVTVGGWVTREVRDFLDTMPIPIPHIFCGVPDPVGMSIVDSLAASGRLVTGVASVPFDFGLQIEMIRALCPSIRAIGLISGISVAMDTVSSFLGKQVSLFMQACKERGIECVEIPLSNPDVLEFLLRDAKNTHGIGVVCALPCLFLAASSEQLIQACTAVGVPLCTSELSSVYHGAAIGFGEHGGVYGMYAASLAYEVLVNHRPIEAMPIVQPPLQHTMRYNYDALIAQGVTVTPAMRHLLSMVSVFFPSQ